MDVRNYINRSAEIHGHEKRVGIFKFLANSIKLDKFTGFFDKLNEKENRENVLVNS